jgi:nucleotide-binding universal stress UspA family protein
MPSISKILLPVDFSDRSEGAVRYAKGLALNFYSELTLLHVLTPPHYEFGALETGGSMLSELYVTRSAQVEKELGDFMAEELQGLAVRRVVLEGDPARKTVEFAESEHIDLIVMPTHGYGRFRRFILGSITAKVLHDADCPVWTGVHLEDAPSHPVGKLTEIVCAVDLGPQSCHALEWAAGLQRELGGRLTVAHAPAYAGDQAGQAAPAVGTEAEARVREELGRLQEQVGIHADVVIEHGDPPKVVCGIAERLKADLLVIARGSARGVFGRLRTNAYAIIRQSPCPVVSV